MSDNLAAGDLADKVSPQRTNAAPSAGAIRFAAMNYLARREHSQMELRQKLRRRFEPPDLVDSVLQQLRAEDLQSDHRFAESFAAARIRRGQGPLRIGGELRLRGVEESTIAAVLDLDVEDWIRQARQVVEKKYGGVCKSLKDRAKQSRFLQYRGFTGEQIQRVLAG